MQNGEPCRVPVNLSSCDYCARHVMKEYNRLRTHRIELQGNALKSAFQPGMQRTLKWKPGHFAPYQAQPKPTLPPTTQTQMKEMAAKAAGRGSTAGSRYVTTVADPAKARAAVADVEQQRLRVNKLAKNAAPIPLARTSKVVYEAPHSGKAQTLKRGRDADRSGSGSGRAVERDSQAPKRGPAATVGSGGSGSGGGALVALEEDDIFVDPGDRAAGGAGGSCLAGGSALARQRAVEVLEGARSESKSAGIPANVPEFLAVPLRLQREKEQEEQRRKEQQKQQQRKEVERQQQRRQATRAAQHITAAAASSRFRVGHAAIAQPAVSINPRPNAPARPVTKPGTKAKPNGKGSAPASGFAAAFGRVIREMEAQQDVSGDTGSLYRDLVEGEDAERLNHVLDTLEKKDAMANKMDSIKSLEVSAWKCNECGTTTEYRPRSCHAAHPRALHRVQGVKRWWQCSGCSKRFATVGVKYPKGRCPKCNEPGTEFTAVSMLRPTRTLEHEAQQGGVAGPDQLLTRGIEQPWVNQ